MVDAGSVLVSSAAVTNTAQTGWLKQQTFISDSLEAGKLETKVSADQMSGESLPSLRVLTLRAENEKNCSCVFSYKGTNPIHKDSTLVTWLPPKGPITLGISVSTNEWWGRGWINIQSTAGSKATWV